jgi:hypothetical protein
VPPLSSIGARHASVKARDPPKLVENKRLVVS